MDSEISTEVVYKVMERACHKARKSWEIAAATEGLLEMYNPQVSVFGLNPFPDNELPRVDASGVRGLAFVKEHILTKGDILVDGNGSIGDEASLGVFAELLGTKEQTYQDACDRQFKHLNNAPKWPNGAISHRSEYAALWADFIFMAPPFIAYHAIRKKNSEIMKSAYDQCMLHRDVLRITDDNSKVHRAWRHIEGPVLEDLRPWATGNAWAVLGMVRVLAAMMKWPNTSTWREEQDSLIESIMGIVEAAGQASASKRSGLLHNIMDNVEWFQDVGSTAAMAAATYRMSILAPSACTESHLTQANEWRLAVLAHIDHETGRVGPTPQGGLPGWTENQPNEDGSSQGHSFVVMALSAYQDWLSYRQGGGPLVNTGSA